MTDKTTEALKLAEEALNAMLTHMGMDEDEWTKPTFDQSRKTLAAIREALADHIADSGKLIPQFIPVGIVNDHHSITWMEEIVDDQAPIGAILYALQDTHATHVVITKDLTDDEIAQAVGSPLDEVYLADFRAVIAKFKEKNK